MSDESNSNNNKLMAKARASAIAKTFSPEKQTFLMVLAVLGVTLVYFGNFVKEKEPIFAALLMSIGGSILGSTFSITFVRVFEPSPLKSVVSQLTQLVELATDTSRTTLLATREEFLGQLRIPFHGYLRSRNPDGTSVWRYRKFDFSLARTPGHLHACVDVPSPAGRSRSFFYNGYLCGHHLVLVGEPRAVGSEQHVVHVFPDALHGLQHGNLCGFCFVESYDDSKLITPSILSEVPILNTETSGVVSKEAAIQLSKLWESRLGESRCLNFDSSSFVRTNPLESRRPVNDK